MVSNRKLTGKEVSMPLGIGIGLLVSLVVTIAGAAVLAYLIVSERTGANGIGYGSIIILAAAAAMGALAATLVIRRRRLLVCGITATGYYLILLAMTALFFGGQYEGLGVTALAVLAGSGLVVLLSMFGNGSRSKRKIPAYR